MTHEKICENTKCGKTFQLNNKQFKDGQKCCSKSCALVFRRNAEFEKKLPHFIEIFKKYSHLGYAEILKHTDYAYISAIFELRAKIIAHGIYLPTIAKYVRANPVKAKPEKVKNPKANKTKEVKQTNPVKKVKAKVIKPVRKPAYNTFQVGKENEVRKPRAFNPATHQRVLISRGTWAERLIV